MTTARRIIGLYTLAEIRDRRRQLRKHGGGAVVDDGPQLFIYDSFDRANGPIGTADVGGPWTDPSGAWTVSSNQAKLSSASGFRVAVITATLEDEGDFTVTMVNVGTHGLCMRRDGGTNNFIGTRVSGGFLRLIRVTSGAATTIGTGGAVNAGDVISVNITGNTYTVYINGTQQFQATESQGDDRYQHGIMSQTSTGRLDEYSMYGPS